MLAARQHGHNAAEDCQATGDCPCPKHNGRKPSHSCSQSSQRSPAFISAFTLEPLGEPHGEKNERVEVEGRFNTPHSCHMSHVGGGQNVDGSTLAVLYVEGGVSGGCIAPDDLKARKRTISACVASLCAYTNSSSRHPQQLSLRMFSTDNAQTRAVKGLSNKGRLSHMHMMPSHYIETLGQHSSSGCHASYASYVDCAVVWNNIINNTYTGPDGAPVVSLFKVAPFAEMFNVNFTNNTATVSRHE